MQILVCNLQ